MRLRRLSMVSLDEDIYSKELIFYEVHFINVNIYLTLDRAIIVSKHDVYFLARKLNSICKTNLVGVVLNFN